VDRLVTHCRTRQVRESNVESDGATPDCALENARHVGIGELALERQARNGQHRLTSPRAGDGFDYLIRTQ